jgi:uncharacterized protein YcaQ
VSPPILPNRDARKLFLARHGLLAPPRTTPVADLLDGLGFVQVDSVLTLARAHDLILWSRSPGYRPKDLQTFVKRRGGFEHWTHDASVLPMEAWPHWRHRFSRDRARMDVRWDAWQGPDFRDALDRTLRHVADQGGTKSSDLLGDAPRKEPGQNAGWWNWHPSKVALEYLWRVGELSVSHREGFQKVYDLTERVVPGPIRAKAPTLDETVAWAANAALDRLGFATPGEIAAFFDLLTPHEAQAWAHDALACGDVQEVRVEGADGKLRRSLARPGTLEEAASLPEPGDRLRLLSPFDPALRDRARAERLFGFRYRIEIFVPAPQRVFAYYVFPLLEGLRPVARTEVVAQNGTLTLRALWPEPGLRWTKGRTDRLLAELDRLSRLTGSDRVELQDGWLREPKVMP